MASGPHLQDEQQERTHKSHILAIGITAFFLLLCIRLFQIQVIQFQRNSQLSKENQMQLKVLKAPRGMMYDRKGRPLILNRPSYSICVLPYKVKHRRTLIANLCKIHDSSGQALFDSTDLTGLIRRAQARRFDPTRIAEDVSMDVVSVIEEHAADFPGVTVEIESRREYALGADGFHVLGYIGEVPEDQFDSLKNKGYHYGDLMGKAGLEKYYESDFKGADGQEFVEVNAYGQVLGTIKDFPQVDPVPGRDLYLTIDEDLQELAAQIFPDSLKGAVVAIDPRSGEVLVMYSNPSVDPNIFSLAPSVRSKEWASIATDPALPLNNRAIQGTYPPGSTFKCISSITGLETGHMHSTSTMPRPCTGAYRIGGRIAHCWELKGHGRLQLTEALKVSCNIFFYQVGLLVGDKNIVKYAKMFGLGQITGIDLPQEKTGWLSGEEEYNKRFAKRGWKWTGGLVLDLAIGQAQVLTPLQLAVMIGTIGNGALQYRPHLVKEIRSHEGLVIKQFPPYAANKVNLHPETIECMRKALKGVIDPGGTGGRAAVPGIAVGGKTGSAQNPHGDLTHSVFVACAPIDTPMIAIAVVLENAGHGGSVAGPIVGDILRYFFTHDEEGRAYWNRQNPSGDTTWMAKTVQLVNKPKIQ